MMLNTLQSSPHSKNDPSQMSAVPRLTSLKVGQSWKGAGAEACRYQGWARNHDPGRKRES